MKYGFLVSVLFFLIKGSNAQPDKPITPEQPDSLPYVWLDTMPRYPGGQAAIHTYIHSKIDYPAREHMHILGTVYVSFIVERNGSLSNAEIKKGINANVDADILRIVRTMNNWKPGIKYGKPVRTRAFLYFKFSPG